MRRGSTCARRQRPLALGLAALSLLLACSDDDAAQAQLDVREPCVDNNPQRNLYFGDLHVHTAWSFDAYLNEVRVDPFDAYRFARGEEVELPPSGTATDPTRVRIDRPLDFAAVTDHAEFLAEVNLCVEPDSPVYDTSFCVDFRNSMDSEVLVAFGLRLNTESPNRFEEICTEGGEGMGTACVERAAEVWARMQEAAEMAYDRSESCEFTSFVGYEWSGALRLSNLHRNVIFRSARVPGLPTSHFEAPRAWELWDALENQCIDGLSGCDALSIPHNSNWSNGNLFLAEYREDMSEAEAAAQRARLEPLMEIYQHKGDSECLNGVSGILGSTDEACDFEKLRLEFEDCGDGTGVQGMVNRGCISRRDYLRGALLAGMAEEARIGVNPFPLGVMASTDTHNGTPGQVSERDYVGHFGTREIDPQARLTGAIPAGPLNSPGGLVAVWAEENSREAIFDAMRRKESYGTSGPRIAVRFFGGWDLPENLCEDPRLVELADANGVPMGGTLGEGPAPAAKPRFVVDALADPGTADRPGMPLQRVQIIKGWIDAEGQAHVEVHDVAGGDNGARVDPLTCEPTGEGAQRLCAVWEDPGFVEDQRAYYYVRVLENPSCRWSTRDCAALAADTPADEVPAACTNGLHAESVQERAWTSPIWSPSP